MARQLLLDLGLPVAPTLDNFIIGRNAGAHHALQRIAHTSAERGIHLWGEAGSGRSHLLRAISARADGRYVDCAREPVPDDDDTIQLWCADNVDAAGPADQIALFNLINAVRGRPGAALVSAAGAAPLQLRGLREDLRTRLGWGLVFQLHPLDDDEKQAALMRQADQRGIVLTPEVARYLLNHFSRDMPSLMRLIDNLDRYALAEHRGLTLPLVRDYARSQTDPSAT